MPDAPYSIGQTVWFSPQEPILTPAPPGPYRVLRRVDGDEDGPRHYALQSLADGHERVCREASLMVAD